MKGMNGMEFAAYLHTLRTAQKPKLTQKALASAIGVSDTAIRQWEQGEHVPGFDYVVRLMPLLGGSLEDAEWLMQDAEGEQKAGERLALDRLGKGDGKLLAAVMIRRLERRGVLAGLTTEGDIERLLRLLAEQFAGLPAEQRARMLAEIQGYITGRLARGESDPPPDQP